MKEQRGISTFQVAAAYIGTVVGAGFASGQEVLQFFGYYGLTGLWGLLIAGILFAFFGWVILKLGLELKAKSHLEVIRESAGRWIGTVIDAVITFFLFGALVAMTAGAGSIFQEQWGISSLVGNILMIVATVATVMTGTSGVINAISFVVPALMVAVLGISIYSVSAAGFDGGALAWSNPGQAAVPFWPLSALVYVSYNLVMAVAILAPLGKEAGDHGVLRRGALWGGIGLGIGAAAILLAVIANSPRATTFDIPMAFIASSISPLVGKIYTGVLLAEVYTTAVGSLYGFVVRVTDVGAKNFRLLTIGTGLVALAASQLGFTRLVRVLYPAVGYAGLLMLAGLTWTLLKAVLMPRLRPAYKPLINNKNKSRKDRY